MAKKNTTYEEFAEKFIPQKATDNYYTPPLIYDAVCTWAKTDIQSPPPPTSPKDAAHAPSTKG